MSSLHLQFVLTPPKVTFSKTVGVALESVDFWLGVDFLLSYHGLRTHTI